MFRSGRNRSFTLIIHFVQHTSFVIEKARSRQKGLGMIFSRASITRRADELRVCGGLRGTADEAGAENIFLQYVACIFFRFSRIQEKPGCFHEERPGMQRTGISFQPVEVYYLKKSDAAFCRNRDKQERNFSILFEAVVTLKKLYFQVTDFPVP